MLHGLRHQIRQPFNGVRGVSECLKVLTREMRSDVWSRGLADARSRLQAAWTDLPESAEWMETLEQGLRTAENQVSNWVNDIHDFRDSLEESLKALHLMLGSLPRLTDLEDMPVPVVSFLAEVIKNEEESFANGEGIRILF